MKLNILLIFILAVCSISVCSGAEMVNPSFETGDFTGWYCMQTNGPANVEAGGPYGNYCAHIQSDGTSGATQYRQDGLSYQSCTFWAKKSGSGNTFVNVKDPSTYYYITATEWTKYTINMPFDYLKFTAAGGSHLWIDHFKFDGEPDEPPPISTIVFNPDVSESENLEQSFDYFVNSTYEDNVHFITSVKGGVETYQNTVNIGSVESGTNIPLENVFTSDGDYYLKLYTTPAYPAFIEDGIFLARSDILTIETPCITWETSPPDSWAVDDYSMILLKIPVVHNDFTFWYKTPTTEYTEMPIPKNYMHASPAYDYLQNAWYYHYWKPCYHTTHGSYSCKIINEASGLYEDKTVYVPYFDPDIHLPDVVIIPVPDVWIDPPQWNVTIPPKYDNVTWLIDYTNFWDGIGGTTNYILYATVGLLLTPLELLNSSIYTILEYTEDASGMVAGFEHCSIIVNSAWDILPDEIRKLFTGAAALGLVIFIYHRRT